MTAQSDQVGRISRRRFAALAGGALAGAALLGACGDGSGDSGETASFGEGDVGILNYALTLEHLQAAFYAAALGSGLLSSADETTMSEFAKEESEHADALGELVERLEGAPAAAPKTRFALESAESAMRTAADLENLGAAAYLAQIPKIENPAALAKVLAIHTVEGRHAAAIERRLGNSITPDGAFAKPATVPTVIKAIEPFMAS
jgi:rubrerythrin